MDPLFQMPDLRLLLLHHLGEERGELHRIEAFAVVGCKQGRHLLDDEAELFLIGGSAVRETRGGELIERGDSVGGGEPVDLGLEAARGALLEGGVGDGAVDVEGRGGGGGGDANASRAALDE